ncbi:hypothetical protein [Fulvivirga sediminis]|uniref:Outer membrane protein beta-barrel domain-containing protein n=1 Tax=Fulvivirga sediminis TaxID=2803949 RepID=A0A937K0Q2_9BACT|nr:hypothetical protein [Fulvivirga sediminis]MBL3655827.1 hypothetical protein [Fulvivirga sediminis]
MSDENNHIEQFFKKHLDVEHSSFIEEDWAKMEKMLDEQDLAAGVPPRSGMGWRRGLTMVAVVALIAFLLGWYGHSWSGKEDNNNELESQAEQLEEVIKSEVLGEAPPNDGSTWSDNIISQTEDQSQDFDQVSIKASDKKRRNTPDNDQIALLGPEDSPSDEYASEPKEIDNYNYKLAEANAGKEQPAYGGSQRQSPVKEAIVNPPLASEENNSTVDNPSNEEREQGNDLKEAGVHHFVYELKENPLLDKQEGNSSEKKPLGESRMKNPEETGVKAGHKEDDLLVNDKPEHVETKEVDKNKAAAIMGNKAESTIDYNGGYVYDSESNNQHTSAMGSDNDHNSESNEIDVSSMITEQEPEYLEGKDGLLSVPYRWSFAPQKVEQEIIEEDIIKEEKSGIQWKEWYVGLSVAPDLNSIGLTSSKQVSGKVGLRFDWDFLPKTSLRVGVYYNRKRYTAMGSDYNPPEGYWEYQTDGVIPSTINGKCRVIDIPITLSYNFLNKGKWTFGASTGISNYILLDQDYCYEFDQPYSGPATRWVTDEKETAKWSIANLSLIAQYSLGRQTFIQVEPYVQVPLQKIGWAQVSLYGTGAMLTIKRKLQF